MNWKTLLIILFFQVSLNIACLASDIIIKSDPSDCDVYIIDPESGKQSLVGKTPFKGDADTIKKSTSNSSTIQVMIYKPGFIPYNIVLSLLGGVDIRLNTTLEVQKDIQFVQDYDLLVADLFDVLRMVRLKDYQSSLQKLEMLERKFPHFSIIHEMKGMIFYLQKNFKMALNFYRKANGINPQNIEAYKMKTYLEKKFKISK